MVFMVYTYIKEINEFRKRKTIHKLFFSELHTKDNIEVILEKSLYIQPIIEKALKQKRLFEKTRLRINYFDNLLQYLLLILTDLRSDLQIRLIEKQQTLKKAEVEIENNIYWTPELSQVSELQMARLDREIEQFEELQRVLVKV